MLGTLKRAGDVLDLFTAEEPEWGATATAQRLGIGKSLAHDVLASLAAIGLLQRVAHGRYRLGWRTISLASVLLRTSGLKMQSRQVVRELADRQGLAVSLAAWDRGRVIYIHRRARLRQAPLPGPLPGSAAPVDVAAPVRDVDGSVAAAIGLDLLGRTSTASVDLHARAVLAAQEALHPRSGRVAEQLGGGLERPAGGLALWRICQPSGPPRPGCGRGAFGMPERGFGRPGDGPIIRAVPRTRPEPDARHRSTPAGRPG